MSGLKSTNNNHLSLKIVKNLFQVLDTFYFEDIGEVSTLKKSGLQLVMHTGGRVLLTTPKAGKAIKTWSVGQCTKQFNLAKINNKFLLYLGIFEILHFYSTSVHHPLSPPLVLKPKKSQNRFLNVCLGAEIGSKKLPKFYYDFSSSFNTSHNINTKELIFCMNAA